MFNLSNETDYKLLSETKSYYYFFITFTLFLFISIFVRLIFLSLEDNSYSLSSDRDASLKALPTIYDYNKNTLAYSDYNYSVKNIKNKVKYLKRDVPLNEISELIFKGNPYIKFEKILTRRYPNSTIIYNVINK